MLHIVPAAAADAVNRIPKHCWVGPHDGPNDYPGFGVPSIEVTEEDEDGNEVISYRGVGEDEEPTHTVWSGRLGAATAALIVAIGEDPSRVPEDASGLTRAALRALYPEVDVDPDPEPAPAPKTADERIEEASAVLAETADLPVVTVVGLADILSRTANALQGEA